MLQFLKPQNALEKLTDWGFDPLLARFSAGNISIRRNGCFGSGFVTKLSFAEINRVFTETNTVFAETPEYQ
ncbi:hypothetical protein [Polluticoccus soli]|uniref:hypothetical protein n=1 Tax=Polluticoccus soli TaxID=3034150 RepID=UPI0023E34D33|nr:hypothetical protein [Flavipsychrobacter sp. JY13-12]